jgi:transcription elongation factor GreA
MPITKQGLSHMEEELKHLKSVARPEVIRAIAQAREHGDLSENAEYHAAREKQSFIEGRLAELEDKIARSEVIDVTTLSGKTVMFGATVTIVDEDTEEKLTYQLVGEAEADVKAGRLAINSPLARALIGKSIGDSVDVMTPKGDKMYEVIRALFPDAPRGYDSGAASSGSIDTPGRRLDVLITWIVCTVATCGAAVSRVVSSFSCAVLRATILSTKSCGPRAMWHSRTSGQSAISFSNALNTLSD